MEDGKESAPITTKETNRLVEKIGKDRARAVAALGIAALALFGAASGKANVGAGVVVLAVHPAADTASRKEAEITAKLASLLKK